MELWTFIRKSAFTKILATKLAFLIFIQVSAPTISYALTEGPSSPEFNDFTPVATSDMVNLSTGDFMYNLPVLNIPGPEGGGYALSLSYNSGVNAETEASWVGYGWTLNPGSITRNTRGLPDDYKGGQVDSYNKSRPNWTSIGGTSVSIEAFSKDKKQGQKSKLQPSLSKNLRFNNYSGYQTTMGIGISYAGLGSISMNHSPNGVTFSANISISFNLKKLAKLNSDPKNLTEIIHTEKIDLKLGLKKMEKMSFSSNLIGSNYGLFTPFSMSMPTTLTKYNGLAVNFNLGMQLNALPIPIGLKGSINGSMNAQWNQYYTKNNGYGYLYSSGAGANASNTLMDYYVEKGGHFDNKELFLGMPFSNYDIFQVSGEGIGGGFRAHHPKHGSYSCNKPNDKKSSIDIFNLSFDLSAGSEVAFGLDLGLGSSASKVEDWGYDNDKNKFEGKPEFRFINDKSGAIAPDNIGTGLATAKISLNNRVYGMRSVSCDEGEVFTENAPAEDHHAKRSSFIDYHTYAFIKGDPGGLAFDKAVHQGQGLSYPGNLGDNAIVEFQVVNENGVTYNYGVPVFTRNQANLSMNVKGKVSDRYLVNQDMKLVLNDDKYKVADSYINKNDGCEALVGEVKTEPFANTFLLTSILGPNYVDVDNNGPSEKDFGAYTKFNMRHVYGKNSSDWYRYRAPYNGFYYNQNSISDTKDDMANVATGEKQVHYLESIETKSHIAFFVTNKYQNNTGYDFKDGSNADRKDGFDAAALEGGKDPAANPQEGVARGGHSLQYLERIVLFSKNNRYKPIKTIHFVYNYSCVPNVPNNVNTDLASNGDGDTKITETGKLTLKGMFTEFGGLKPALLSPYEFSYVYKRLDSKLLNDEPDYSYNEQNPDYNPHYLDAWGNISPYNRERHNNDMNWVYQGKIPDASQYDLQYDWRKFKTDGSRYDPAAWHLKQIRLPSGGEIHIRYEEKDYRYVQDREVCSLVSLVKFRDNNYARKIDDAYPKCYLNLDDIGIADHYSRTPIETYCEKLKAYFGLTSDDPADLAKGSKNKIYFKFLYSLVGGETSLDNENSEYITGYSNVRKIYVVEDDNHPVKKLWKDGSLHTYQPYTIVIELGKENTGGGEYACVPRQAAYDLFINQKQGLLDADNFNPLALDIEGIHNLINGEASFAQKYLPSQNGTSSGVFNAAPLKITIGAMAVKELRSAITNLLYFNPPKGKIATSVSPELSYLKLPLFKSKRGGGARVKSLLMYDEGLEGIDKVLYGTEYHYVLDDGLTSSGVATNEPQGIREENPLVEMMARQGQSIYERLTVGDNKKQTEGPLGESILPGPSITYSRVVTHNIAQGIHGTGFSVNEYYTTRDYPFDKAYNFEEDYVYELDGTLVSNMLAAAPLSPESKERCKSLVNEAYTVEGLSEQLGNLISDDDLTCGQCTKDDQVSALIDYIEANANLDQKDLKYDFSGKSVSKTSLNDERERDFLIIPFEYFNYKMNKTWAAQGFRFIQNSMNGLHKKTSQYSGSYLGPTGGKDTDNGALVAYNEDIYFEPGEKVRVIQWDYDPGTYKEQYESPGREIEVAVEKTKLSEKSMDFNVSVDVGIGVIFFPPIYITGWPTASLEEASIYKHATTKMISYPAILKKSIAYQDGITNETEHLAFNGLTGKPALTKSYDSFHGIMRDGAMQRGEIYSLQLPAAFRYSGMGRKAEDPENTNQLSTAASQIVSYNKRPSPQWFNTDPANSIKPENILSYSVQTFKKDWASSWDDYRISNQYFEHLGSGIDIEELKEKLNKIYRPYNQWAYKDDETSSDASAHIAETGFYTVDKVFDWSDNAISGETQNYGNIGEGYWLKVNQATKYSPYGQVLEEKNIGNMYSAAVYSNNGYKVQMPVMTAQNARNSLLYFNSFEEYKPIRGYDYLEAHSGTGYKRVGRGSEFPLEDIKLPGYEQGEKLVNPLEGGAIVKFWTTGDEGMIDMINIKCNGQIIPVCFIAQNGYWQLLEGHIPAQVFPQPSDADAQLDVQIENNGNNSILIDDVRFQPANASATCYVYDRKSLKLLAQFDDQHFGLYFQYDEQGQLIRKLIETERGLKTIQENQYNTDKMNRIYVLDTYDEIYHPGE